MATTTTFGYKIPEAGDLAASWMDNIEDNWERMDAHSHDGVDSVGISTTSLTKLTSTILSASWVSDGGGNYSQVVTTPGAITEVNDYHMQFYDTATGDRVHPCIEREAATMYTIRVNDNTLAVTAVYV